MNEFSTDNQELTITRRELADMISEAEEKVEKKYRKDTFHQLFEGFFNWLAYSAFLLVVSVILLLIYKFISWVLSVVF